MVNGSIRQIWRFLSVGGIPKSSIWIGFSMVFHYKPSIVVYCPPMLENRQISTCFHLSGWLVVPTIRSVSGGWGLFNSSNVIPNIKFPQQKTQNESNILQKPKFFVCFYYVFLLSLLWNWLCGCRLGVWVGFQENECKMLQLHLTCFLGLIIYLNVNTVSFDPSFSEIPRMNMINRWF